MIRKLLSLVIVSTFVLISSAHAIIPQPVTPSVAGWDSAPSRICPHRFSCMPFPPIR